MKMVMAVVKPSVLDDVIDALASVGVAGMTVTDVRGYGRQKGKTEVYRGAEYQVLLLPKVKLEIAAEESMVDQIVETIQATAKTGKIGDGKIFVLDLESVMRIRTGETDAQAVAA